jgi:16S rRNA (guanine527-N7)-methyltransferase
LDESLPAENIALAVRQADMSPLASGVPEQFSVYFDLLQRWNAKLNLTAIRNPEDVLQRHFVECIFCAQNLPEGIGTLLDYGSGGGFPGIPIALCRPEIRVTMAESQGKKASFLREATRVLSLNAEVYVGRVEDMDPDRKFDAVTLRAVDKMQAAIRSAVGRIGKEGWLALLASSERVHLPDGFVGSEMTISGSVNRVLILASRRCST